MANVTLRDVPIELHSWLKQRAASHHRSVNKEVITARLGIEGHDLLLELLERSQATIANQPDSHTCPFGCATETKGANQ